MLSKMMMIALALGSGLSDKASAQAKEPAKKTVISGKISPTSVSKMKQLARDHRNARVTRIDKMEKEYYQLKKAGSGGAGIAPTKNQETQRQAKLAKLEKDVLTLSKQKMEIGSVIWQRDVDEALKMSKASGKPLLILFQELPG